MCPLYFAPVLVDSEQITVQGALTFLFGSEVEVLPEEGWFSN